MGRKRVDASGFGPRTRSSASSTTRHSLGRRLSVERSQSEHPQTRPAALSGSWKACHPARRTYAHPQLDNSRWRSLVRRQSRLRRCIGRGGPASLARLEPPTARSRQQMGAALPWRRPCGTRRGSVQLPLASRPSSHHLARLQLPRRCSSPPSPRVSYSDSAAEAVEGL